MRPYQAPYFNGRGGHWGGVSLDSHEWKSPPTTLDTTKNPSLKLLSWRHHFWTVQMFREISRVYWYQHLDFPKKKSSEFISARKGHKKERRTWSNLPSMLGCELEVFLGLPSAIQHHLPDTKLMSSSNIKHLSLTQFLNIILSKPF